MSAVVEEVEENTSEQETPVSNDEHANKVVRKYAAASVLPSLVPIPVVDLVAVTGIQLKMLHSLAKIYDLPFKEELARSVISSLIGGTAALGISRIASSAVKAIPGIGNLVGALTMPTVSGATTYALGQVFIQHFESGGTFLTFDASKVRDYFQEQYEKGKSIVADATKSGEVGKGTDTKRGAKPATK